MSTWACQNCGCAGVTIPHAYRRSPICDWCTEDFAAARKRWCAHCRQGQPLALWASPRSKRCRPCTSAYDRRRVGATHRAQKLAEYHADPDRTIYRIRLQQLATRSCTRGDQIFAAVRQRIALAAFVARTPGWSWTMRARRAGMSAGRLALAYRQQCAGRVADPDRPDAARPQRSTR